MRLENTSADRPLTSGACGEVTTKQPRQRGFTFMEFLVTLAILGILLGMGVPYAGGVIGKGRLKNAAEDALGALTFAKSEAVARNSDVFVSFSGDGSETWCYGIAAAAGCDCTETDVSHADACRMTVAGTNVLKRASSDDFPGIELASTAYEAQFDWVRGAATNGSLDFTNDAGLTLRVVVSALGRVEICSPGGSGKVPGYSDC